MVLKTLKSQQNLQTLKEAFEQFVEKGKWEDTKQHYELSDQEAAQVVALLEKQIIEYELYYKVKKFEGLLRAKEYDEARALYQTMSETQKQRADQAAKRTFAKLKGLRKQSQYPGDPDPADWWKGPPEEGGPYDPADWWKPESKRQEVTSEDIVREFMSKVWPERARTGYYQDTYLEKLRWVGSPLTPEDDAGKIYKSFKELWNEYKHRAYHFQVATKQYAPEEIFRILEEAEEKLLNMSPSRIREAIETPTAEEMEDLFGFAKLKGFRKQSQFGFGYHGDGQSNFSVPNSEGEMGPGNSGIDNTGPTTPSSSYTDYAGSRVKVRKEREEANKRRKQRREKLKNLVKKKEAARPGDLLGPNRKNRIKGPGNLLGPGAVTQRHRYDTLRQMDEELQAPQQAYDDADIPGMEQELGNLGDASEQATDKIKDTGTQSTSTKQKLKDLQDQSKETQDQAKSTDEQTTDLQDNIKKLEDTLRRIM